MDTPTGPDPTHRSIELVVNPLHQQRSGVGVQEIDGSEDQLRTPRKVLVGSHYDGFHAPQVSKRDTNVALIWSLVLLFLFASGDYSWRF